MTMQKLPITLYRRDQVRELDQRAIHQANISGIELMSRAGHEVFQFLKNKWPAVKSIAVFCGAGNNAGDGFIVAKLALDAGLSVTVYSLTDSQTIKGDALIAYQNYVDAHGVIIPFQDKGLIDVDVIVDALLGIGLDRPVTGLYALAIQAINKSIARVIAVDNPSGINADTGHVMGFAIKADCTVTFIGLKQGLFTGNAANYCGEISYASLGVPDSIFGGNSPSASRVIKKPLPIRDRCSHKGNYGHVLIVGGDFGYSGAVKMAGEAALRVGTGLVSIATRKEHAGLLNLNRPELMCHGVEGAEQLLGLIAKASVIAIGPGLGQSDWSKELFMVTINAQKPLIIDADALNLLALAPFTNTNWILTPHPGEAARLLNCSTLDIQQDRFASASALQDKYKGIVILKGSGTLITSENDCAVSTTGNPGMASGGMGDILTGIIAGLVAQGLTLKEGAQQGVYVHGEAADLAAKEGERGLLASDLMPYLRQVVN